MFQLQQMPPLIYGDSQTEARRLNDNYIHPNQYRLPTGYGSNLLPPSSACLIALEHLLNMDLACVHVSVLYVTTNGIRVALHHSCTSLCRYYACFSVTSVESCTADEFKSALPVLVCAQGVSGVIFLRANDR